MSAGDVWEMPGGHRALEMDGSTRTVLRLAVIVPNWPFPKPPVEVARSLCKRLPSKYLSGAVPEDVGEAKW